MPRTPKELEKFIRGVVNESVTRPNSPPIPEEQREHAIPEVTTPAERRLLLKGVLVGRELLARATEVFDDRNVALDWIFEPNSALNGKTPLRCPAMKGGENRFSTFSAGSSTASSARCWCGVFVSLHSRV
jgi:hypothetical protein